MKLRINYNLCCVVDTSKSQCLQEPAHCHITKNGSRVAQVWLNPVRLESGYDLSHREMEEVYDFVSEHKYELEREYENNRLYGAD